MEQFWIFGCLFLFTTLSYNSIVSGDVEIQKETSLLKDDINVENRQAFEEEWQKDQVIVGGKPAKRGEFPWIVGIWAFRNPKHPYNFCGGSLVNRQWVLTAAHCVQSYKSNFKVLRIIAGDHDVKKKDPTEQIIGIKRIIIHQGYKNQLNDVALLKLSKPVTLSKSVKVIGMAPKKFKVPKSATLGVAGWGATKEGGSGSNVLKKVYVKKVEFSDCKKKFSKINQGNICAGVEKGGKDSCQGDSGGPLWYNKYLVGVVSWGRGCARPGKPGIYAKVAHYRSWIDGMIGKKEDDTEEEEAEEE